MYRGGGAIAVDVELPLERGLLVAGLVYSLV